LKLSTDDVVCLTAPLHTVAGFAQGAVAAAVAGAKVVVPTKEFNSDEAVRATTDYFVTTLVATKDQAAAITAGVPSKSFKAAVA
jgi:acyl-CoA synthetase (AMP-forming)/AMP-acid ligase II